MRSIILSVHFDNFICISSRFKSDPNKHFCFCLVKDYEYITKYLFRDAKTNLTIKGIYE